ncbi:uncharacterized protein TNCV_4597901 [Trichonephila clavipes]|nr:uncharacterized protein TNCV_4597901 [Trichonephila clavipes]
MPLPRFEPRPYDTAVSVINHYTVREALITLDKSRRTEHEMDQFRPQQHGTRLRPGPRETEDRSYSGQVAVEARTTRPEDANVYESFDDRRRSSYDEPYHRSRGEPTPLATNRKKRQARTRWRQVKPTIAAGLLHGTSLGVPRLEPTTQQRRPRVREALSLGKQLIPHRFNRTMLSKLSDEAHFWLNGYVNKQNYRIWSEANPQVYVETPLHPEKLTVWCALWAGGILLQKR